MPTDPTAQESERAPQRSLIEQRDALAEGAVTSEALVRRAIQHRRRARTLNAFWSLRADAALDEARDADRRLAEGERLPLLGVPIAVKDDIDVAGRADAVRRRGHLAGPRRGCRGRPSTAGRGSHRDRQDDGVGDGAVAGHRQRRLRPSPATPWNLDYTSGGSSGGSSAAVAAGIPRRGGRLRRAPLRRIPAAWTHLVGIKPQRGRISTWPHDDDWRGLSVIGPIARSVADAALLLDVMTGSRPGDRVQLPEVDTPFADAARRQPRPTAHRHLRSIAFNGMRRVNDPEVDRALEAVADDLRALGHTVVKTRLWYGPQFGATFMPRAMVGLEDWMRLAPDRALVDRRIRRMALRRASSAGRSSPPRDGWSAASLRRSPRVPPVDVVITPPPPWLRSRPTPSVASDVEDEPAPHHRVPVRMAVERARVARDQRPCRAHRGGASGRRAAPRPGFVRGAADLARRPARGAPPLVDQWPAFARELASAPADESTVG